MPVKPAFSFRPTSHLYAQSKKRKKYAQSFPWQTFVWLYSFSLTFFAHLFRPAAHCHQRLVGGGRSGFSDLRLLASFSNPDVLTSFGSAWMYVGWTKTHSYLLSMRNQIGSVNQNSYVFHRLSKNHIRTTLLPFHNLQTRITFHTRTHKREDTHILLIFCSLTNIANVEYCELRWIELLLQTTVTLSTYFQTMLPDFFLKRFGSSRVLTRNRNTPSRPANKKKETCWQTVVSWQWPCSNFQECVVW